MKLFLKDCKFHASLRNSAAPLWNSAKHITGCYAKKRKIFAKFRKVNSLLTICLLLTAINTFSQEDHFKVMTRISFTCADAEIANRRDMNIAK